MNLLNEWHVVLRAKELKVSECYQTWLFGESIILFRNKDNKPVCIKNRCPHRLSPFIIPGINHGKGTVKNGEIICPYHEGRFTTEEGYSVSNRVICTHLVDNQYKKYASNIAAWSYPCAEYQGYIWIWYTGKASQEKIQTPLDTIPKDLWFNKKDWACIELITDYNSEVFHMIENFLDIVHVFYLHSGTVSKKYSRETAEKLGVKILYPEKDKDIIQCVFKFQNGKHISKVRFIPPGHILIEGNMFIQVLDFQALGRRQTRVYQRLYRKFFLSGKYIPFFNHLYRCKSLEILFQDYKIMEMQTQNSILYGRFSKSYPIKEDQLIQHYYHWYQKQLATRNPWLEHLVHPIKEENLPTVPLLYLPAVQTMKNKIRSSKFFPYFLLIFLPLLIFLFIKDKFMPFSS